MTGMEWRAEGIARKPSVRVSKCDRGYAGSGIPVFAADPDPERETIRKRP